MTISATTQGLRMGVATSSTRPTVPFDGQVISETDTDSLKVYKASTWGSVSGLVYLTGATFTTVASVSLPTSTFTASYPNYKIIFVGTAVSTTLSYTMRMRSAGTDETTSLYNNGVYGYSNNANIMAFGSNIQSSWTFGGSDAGQQPLSLSFDICDPFTTSKTRFMGAGNVSTVSSGSGGAVVGGFYNATTSFDSLSLIASTGTISGFYRVYGYSES